MELITQFLNKVLLLFQEREFRFSFYPKKMHLFDNAAESFYCIFNKTTCRWLSVSALPQTVVYLHLVKNTIMQINGTWPKSALSKWMYFTFRRRFVPRVCTSVWKLQINEAGGLNYLYFYIGNGDIFHVLWCHYSSVVKLHRSSSLVWIIKLMFWRCRCFLGPRKDSLL